MSCSLEPGRSALQLRLDLIEVGIRILRSQQLLGAEPGLLCATHVNLRGLLRSLRQNHNPIRQDFKETSGAKEILPAVRHATANFTNAEFSEKGRMSWKDSKVATRRWNRYFVYPAAEEPLLRRHDFQLNLIRHSD